MSKIELKTLSGKSVSIGEESIEQLRSCLRGSVILRDEPGYEEARTVWNAMVDRRPGLVVRCAGPSDVIQAVRFAGQHDLLLAVRAAGHNIAGKAVCDDGLLIDLSGMRAVRVDREHRRAWVEPGATLADLDHEAQAFGLATPVGINSTTGIAGLTLGGGFGWITRKFGMTIDNLLEVDIVTADGEMRRASAEQSPDLFWALRGGGGNFGVVTGFSFQLHPLGPEVMSGLIIHPLADAEELMRGYRRFAAKAPDEVSAWVILRKAPPLPFLPAEWHGREVLVFAACYAGEMNEGEKALAPLRALGKPIVDVIGPHSFTAWQGAFDPLLTPGARNYWKSHDFRELTDELCSTVIEFAGHLPTPECEIFIGQVGGAMGRVGTKETAYGGRDAEFIMNVHTRWQDPSDDARCMDWAREFFEATRPHSLGTAYVNFLSEEDEARLASTYGPNYARLAKIKAGYDPRNLFRVNQNIQPTEHMSKAS